LDEILIRNSQRYINAVKQKGQSGMGGFSLGAGRAGKSWASGISSGSDFSGDGASANW
jgi:hypothetical protein